MDIAKLFYALDFLQSLYYLSLFAYVLGQTMQYMNNDCFALVALGIIGSFCESIYIVNNYCSLNDNLTYYNRKPIKRC
jgi:hypothetical protein